MKRQAQMMRQMILLMATLMLSTTVMKAQKAVDQLYLTVDDVPDGVYWLPAPAEPGSSQFMYDISQYYWGKKQRLDSLRARKAIREAAYEVSDMAE